MKKEDKITVEQVLKYKQNSTNHMLHFSGKMSGQKEGAYIHISTVYEAMEEYAALKAPVQEQSKQEVKDKFFKQFLSPHKRLDRMYLYEGEAEEVFAWFEPYLSLPKEQKDKVTGVSDEELLIKIQDEIIRSADKAGLDDLQTDLLNESITEAIRTLLSSKAVEQKEPDVKDGFEKVLDDIILEHSKNDIDVGKTKDVAAINMHLGIATGLQRALHRYRKFSPPIQEAEHKQGVTDLEKFASWLGQHRAEFYSRCGYAIIDNKRTEGISPKDLVELFLRSLFGEKGKEAKDE